MKRIFLDMDGVIVDFDSFRKDCADATGELVKTLKGAYLQMDPMPEALEGVRSLIGMGYDVWLATKPPTGIPWAYADKVEWVLNHLPELKRKIIITHDKSLLLGDYLVDDRPHKANCEKFTGELVRFGPNFQMDWIKLLEFFRNIKSKEITCYWVCELCGGEFPFDPDKWPHGIDISSCLLCNNEMRDGKKFYFTHAKGKCPKCPKDS